MEGPTLAPIFGREQGTYPMQYQALVGLSMYSNN